MSDTIRTDLPFALVPEWVLAYDISDRAFRLYAVLARYADNEGESFPSRKTLAEWLRCSTDSIDRALRELTEAGALTTEERRRNDGGQTSNLYTIHRVPPSRTGAEGGSRTGEEAMNETHEGSSLLDPSEKPSEQQHSLTEIVELDQSSARVERATAARLDRERLGKIGGKAVKPSEQMRAELVLDYWNHRTGQTLTSDDWLRMIVRRVREHPELDHTEHAGIIEHVLADPWWDGHPSPNVIYGNGAQFERCLTNARNGPAPPRNGSLRYGRGMTPGQILEATRGLE